MRSILSDPAPDLLSVSELKVACVEVEAAAQALLARRAALLAELDARTGGEVMNSVGVVRPVQWWLRDATGMSSAAATRALAVARGLAVLPQVLAAAVAGEVRLDRAEVLALRLVPAVPAAALSEAEPALLEGARLCEPGPLVSRIRDWVADHCPDQFADAEAHVGRWLQLDSIGCGRWRIHGQLDAVGTETLKTALEALSSRTLDGVRVPLRVAHANGLVELAAIALAAGELPDSGGLKPQVTVVVEATTLAGEPGPAGRAAHVGPLTRADVLSLCCDADLHLAHLDTHGQLVALQTPQRIVPPSLRRALNARDRGCAHSGCDAPAARCHAHHLIHWADGGPTALGNLALLCPRHHRAWHRGQIGRHHLRLPDEPPATPLPPPWQPERARLRNLAGRSR